MAAAIKVIWRLDFDVNPVVLDRPGSVIGLLTSEKDLWNQVGQGVLVNNSVVAQYADGDSFRNISVEPQSINGVMEWAKSVALDQLLADQPFPKIDLLVTELLKFCEIKAVKRAGIRFFGVGGNAENNEKIDAYINKLILSKIEAALDEIRDFGLVIDGITKDKILYRAIFGPLAEKNIRQTIISITLKEDSLKELMDSYRLFFDLDFFETNISFSEHSLRRWAGTKAKKAIDFTNQFVNLKSSDSGKR